MGNMCTTGASPMGRRTMVFLSAGVDVGNGVIGSLEAEHGASGGCGKRGRGCECGQGAGAPGGCAGLLAAAWTGRGAGHRRQPGCETK